MKADNKDETAGKVTITGDGRMVPEKAKIAPELEAVQHLMPMSADDREACLLYTSRRFCLYRAPRH